MPKPVLEPDIRTIRPAEGRKVRWPFSDRVLAEAGEAVTWSSYWERRLRDKDVEQGAAPAKPNGGAQPQTQGQSPETAKVS